LWRHPATERVAELLGFRTIVDAEIRNASASTSIGPIGVPPDTADGPARIVIRPESLVPDPQGPISGTVVSVTFRGADSLAVIETDGGPVEAELSEPPEIGSAIRLAADPSGIAVLRPAR
jgi:ABC-type Fe3+/spermidine/putrescine transport system ATPase subunit